MTKEGVATHEYEIALEKYKENPEINEKPTFEIRRCIVRFPYINILNYKIMETGDVEPEKKEIKINTTYGYYYCDYTKQVHTYLKSIIEKIETQIDSEYKTNEEE